MGSGQMGRDDKAAWAYLPDAWQMGSTWFSLSGYHPSLWWALPISHLVFLLSTCLYQLPTPLAAITVGGGGGAWLTEEY